MTIINCPKGDVVMNPKISNQSLEAELENLDLSERRIPFQKRSISDTMLYIDIDPKFSLYGMSDFTETEDSDFSEINSSEIFVNDLTNEDLDNFVDLNPYEGELNEPPSEFLGDMEDAYYEELSCLEELEKDIETLEVKISSLKVQLRECERMCRTADEENRIMTAMVEEARACEAGKHDMAKLIELMDEQQRIWNLRFM